MASWEEIVDQLATLNPAPGDAIIWGRADVGYSDSGHRCIRITHQLTTTTIVCPAVTSGLWRVTAHYYTGA